MTRREKEILEKLEANQKLVPMPLVAEAIALLKEQIAANNNREYLRS